MIDIIVVTYNAVNKLKRCLNSIKENTKDIRYLLTVVDNNSSDGTRNFLKRYACVPNIKVISLKKNLGFSGGANAGIKDTSNKFIAFVDDDIEVTEGWLKKLYNHIRSNPQVGIVGPKIVFPNNRIDSAFFKIGPMSKSAAGHDEFDRGQHDYIRECDALIGACWLMRRKLVDNGVGYFDEDFFPSQEEDIDYCIRTRLAGYKIVYMGTIKVFHHRLLRDGGKTQNSRNVKKFYQKWGNKLSMFPLADSHYADKCIGRVYDHLSKGRFKAAVDEFKTLNKNDRKIFEPFLLGVALEGKGEYVKAIRVFKKFLSLNPDFMGTHFFLAALYKKVGLKEKAENEVKILLPYLHQKYQDM